MPSLENWGGRLKSHVKLGVYSCVFTITPVKLLAMYLLLELSEVFFANMQDMLATKLPDIESEIYALLFQKNRVSDQMCSSCL